jgi:hypothetical protein
MEKPDCTVATICSKQDSEEKKLAKPSAIRLLTKIPSQREPLQCKKSRWFSGVAVDLVFSGLKDNQLRVLFSETLKLDRAVLTLTLYFDMI